MRPRTAALLAQSVHRGAVSMKVATDPKRFSCEAFLGVVRKKWRAHLATYQVPIVFTLITEVSGSSGSNVTVPDRSSSSVSTLLMAALDMTASIVPNLL